MFTSLLERRSYHNVSYGPLSLCMIPEDGLLFLFPLFAFPASGRQLHLTDGETY